MSEPPGLLVGLLPLPPPYTLDPLIASRQKKSASALRQRPGRGGRTQGSYPHGHNDAAEALPFVWFEQGGGQRIVDVHRDLRLLHHTQEVQEVPGVEPDGGLGPSILHRELLLRLAEMDIR